MALAALITKRKPWCIPENICHKFLDFAISLSHKAALFTDILIVCCFTRIRRSCTPIRFHQRRQGTLNSNSVDGTTFGNISPMESPTRKAVRTPFEISRVQDTAGSCQCHNNRRVLLRLRSKHVKVHHHFENK